MESTRGEIERSVALLLGESLGSPGSMEPMWLREAVNAAVDHVALTTGCYQTWFDMGTTGTTEAPMGTFCKPRELYKLRTVRLTLSDGSYKLFRRTVEIVNAYRMDRDYPRWREDPETGEPNWLVQHGDDLTFYPLVTWTDADAIRLYGHAVPGPAWSGVPANALAPTDVFPLPEYARPAVVYHAAYLRLIQTADQKGSAARLPHVEAQALRQLASVTRAAAREYQDGAH